MQGTVIEAWGAREVKGAAPQKVKATWRNAWRLEGQAGACQVDRRREHCICRATEHEATWLHAPKSDLENMVNGVKMYLFQSHQSRHP